MRKAPIGNVGMPYRLDNFNDSFSKVSASTIIVAPPARLKAAKPSAITESPTILSESTLSKDDLKSGGISFRVVLMLVFSRAAEIRAGGGGTLLCGRVRQSRTISSNPFVALYISMVSEWPIGRRGLTGYFLFDGLSKEERQREVSDSFNTLLMKVVGTSVVRPGKHQSQNHT